MNHETTFEKRLVRRVSKLVRIHWPKALLLVAVACAGASMNHFLFPSYSATSILHVRTAEESPLLKSIGKISGLQWNQYPTESPTDKYLKILKSSSFVLFVTEQIETIGVRNSRWRGLSLLLPFHEGELKAAEIAALMAGSTNFVSRDDLIEVIARSRKRELATRISDQMLEFAQQYITYYERKDIDDAERYLSEQLEITQKRIDKINREIERYRDDQDFLNIASGGTESFASKSVGRLKEEEQMILYKIDEIKMLLEKYRHDIGEDAGEISGRGRFVDRIRQLRDELEVYNTKLSAVQGRINSTIRAAKPQFEQKVYDLKKKLDLEHNLYQEIQRQLFDNRIYRITVENQIRPYEVATEGSTGRDSSLFSKLILGSIFALFSAVFLVLVWEKIFPVVSEKRHLIEVGLNFLGSVPDVLYMSRGVRSIVSGGRRTAFEPIHNPKIRNKVTTTFQFLGTRIVQYLLKKTGTRKGIVSLVSLRAGEGKSVTSANLGVVFGSFGLKTLIVDGDWFKQVNPNYLGIERQEGLVEILVEDRDLANSIHKTKYPNLFYLSAGLKQKILDVIKEDKYHQLLERLRGNFDIIIVDTPAFEVGPESLALAGFSDMTIVVTQAHRTPRDELRDLVEMLPIRGHAEVYGLINGADMAAHFSEAYYQVYTHIEDQQSA